MVLRPSVPLRPAGGRTLNLRPTRPTDVVQVLIDSCGRASNV
jgi:hypothetical protein